MGALKDHLHEVIANEPASVADLKVASDAAWDGYRALLDGFPVYRSAEQQRLLDRAHSQAEWASWRYDTAMFWEEYHSRNCG